MGPKATMTWDAVAERTLLMGILKVNNVKVDTKSMVKYMAEKGYTCTDSAIDNKVKKLKASVRDDDAEEGGDAPKSAPKPKAAPRKREASAAADGEKPAKKGRATKVKKTKSAATVEVEGDDKIDGEEIKKEAEGEDDLV